jgi:ribosomal protein S18 acetylase RimI-like enzyme
LAFDVVFRALSDEYLALLPQFDCGRKNLNAFLVEDAPEYHKHGLTHTTLVFVQDDSSIAGFFSLSSDSVTLSAFEAGELGLPFQAEIKFFPAVKITRFAIQGKYQRSGLGLQLIDAIEGLVYADGSSSVATRLLTVDAVNEDDVIAFYRKAQFEPCLEAERRAQKQKRETILMFKDIYA